MAEIEGKFGTNLSRVQLANIMFRSDTTAAIIENVEPSTSIGVTRFRYRTVVFETMLIFHAIFNSQSYKSVGRLMTLQKLLLCDKTILKTEIFNKPIQCGEMKARAIVRDVLGDFCLKIVSIMIYLYTFLNSFQVNDLIRIHYKIRGFHYYFCI